MMDNLRLHKSNDVKERMDSLGFHYCYTPKYSPQYNGVEEIIGMGKKLVKGKRLELLLHNKSESLDKIILESFKSLNVGPKLLAHSTPFSIKTS